MPAKHSSDIKQNSKSSNARAAASRRHAAHNLKSQTKKLPGYENENIHYQDAEVLSRPLNMPPTVRAIVIVALVVAAFIGAIMIWWYVDTVFNSSVREQEALEENLSREVIRNVPDLISFMSMDDEQIMSALNEEGNSYYEVTPLGTLSEGGFEIAKLPDDLSADDMAAMYLRGISKLSASEAVQLLNGSWDLTISRNDGTDIYLTYADFSSRSLESALQKAINEVGLQDEEIAESGEDASGNTYATGTIERVIEQEPTYDDEYYYYYDDDEEEVESEIYTWRISVIDLTEIYDISGLPDNSYYVGIRLMA